MKIIFSKHSLLLFAFLVSYNIVAQDLLYARDIVNTLASEAMKGRGYVKGGNDLAANFIREEFQKNGLKKFGANYFQPFMMSVNTFPDRMDVRINTIDLIPGIDYLVDAGSPSIAGVYRTVRLTTDDLLMEDKLTSKLKSSTGKFLVLDAYDKKLFNKEENKKLEDVIAFLKYSADNPAKGTLVLTWDKLTWWASQEQYAKPAIIIKVDSIYKPIEQITLKVKSKLIQNFESKNIIGFIEGKMKDSVIVFTAHYDHLGMMGNKTIFPGANDNASGIALLLNLAKYYSVNKPEYTTVFIAFGGEEVGLLGSKYFTKNSLFALNEIKFLINFDLAGTGEEGVQVVNVTIHREQFDLLYQINIEHNFLADVKIRGEACNSDHCFFTKKQVPCFFIYTLEGIKAYHDIYDKSETLPLTKFENYFNLIITFVKRL